MGDNIGVPRSGIQAANGEPAGKYSAAIVGLLILVSVVAFLPALRGEFLNWDDDRNFVENEAFRGVGLEQVRWAWSTYHLGVWQPLAWILLGVEYGLFGLRPTGYHAFSIGIHACNAVLVYMIARRVLTRCRAGWPAT